MKRQRRLSIVAALTFTAAASIHAQTGTGTGTGTQFELTFWQSVTGSDDPAVYEAYLAQYPTGTFSGLAKAKLANLRKSASPVPDRAPAQPSIFVPIPVPAGQVPDQSARLTSIDEGASKSPAQHLPARQQATGVEMPVTPAPAKVAASSSVAMAPISAQPTAKPLRIAPMSDENESALLEELAKSQELGGSTMLVAAAEGFVMPLRPIINEVPELLIPTAFCSAEERNIFHETRYKPAMDVTRLNNETTVAHMQKLQRLYDSLQLSRDPNPMNAVANEATSYQKDVAKPVYDRQLQMVQKFEVIMAVPISLCQPATAK